MGQRHKGWSGTGMSLDTCKGMLVLSAKCPCYPCSIFLSRARQKHGWQLGAAHHGYDLTFHHVAKPNQAFSLAPVCVLTEANMTCSCMLMCFQESANQQLSGAMQRRIQHNLQLAARCARLEAEKQHLAQQKTEVQGEFRSTAVLQRAAGKKAQQ